MMKLHGNLEIIQTVNALVDLITKFENDVKMYGIQTVWTSSQHCSGFENDVKMYGIQTAIEQG